MGRRFEIHVYSSSEPELASQPIATAIISDQREQACWLPEQVDARAQFFLERIEASSDDIKQQIGRILQQPFVTVSRSGAYVKGTAQGTVRVRGDYSAQEPYGTASYWRAAIGRLGSEAKLSYDREDYRRMLTGMETGGLFAAYFPALSSLAGQSKELLDLMKQSLGETLLRPWKVLQEVGLAGLNREVLSLCTGFIPQRAFGKSADEDKIKAEDAVAEAIRNLAHQPGFPEEVAEVALPLADALGDASAASLDRAIRNLTTLLLKRESLELRLLLAYCYRKRGSADDAEEQLKKAVGIIQRLRDSAEE